MKKLIFWWNAETPKIARLFQVLSGALAALPLYYVALPDDFKTTIPISYLKWICISGGVCAFILQFFNKKDV